MPDGNPVVLHASSAGPRPVHGGLPGGTAEYPGTRAEAVVARGLMRATALTASVIGYSVDADLDRLPLHASGRQRLERDVTGELTTRRVAQKQVGA